MTVDRFRNGGIGGTWTEIGSGKVGRRLPAVKIEFFEWTCGQGFQRQICRTLDDAGNLRILGATGILQRYLLRLLFDPPAQRNPTCHGENSVADSVFASSPATADWQLAFQPTYRFTT
ncbi:MAG: hypothetical protein WBF93_05865 [Pirellulales bacterium]|nr:hypothetical protein [Pirellulales bacterium]